MGPARSDGDGPPRRTDHDVVLLLSSSVGLEKAQECVTQAIQSLGFTPSGLTRADALAILELLAMQQGIVGVTARFAKSRVHLKWSERPGTR